MNQLQRYEQSIARKLAELPVPDMADAIWGDIEARLDLDLPRHEPDAPGSTQPPGGGLSAGMKFFAGAAGIAMVAFLLTRFNSNQSTSMPAAPLQNIPVADTVNQDKPTQPALLPATAEQRQPRQSATSPPGNSPAADTTVLMPNLWLADTGQLQPTTLPPSAALRPDSISAPATPPVQLPKPGKKSRGTRNISDSDYRFVPGKDST